MYSSFAAQVVSQSALVALIHQNIASFSATFLASSIAELKACVLCDATRLMHRQVGTMGKIVTVTQRHTYWDAFQLINQKYISAVGVVDREGVLVGCISAHDLQARVQM